MEDQEKDQNQKDFKDYLLEYIRKNGKGRSLTQEQIDELLKKREEKDK